MPQNAQTWRVGTVTITKILELELSGDCSFFPRGTLDEVKALDWLAPNFATEAGELKFSVHSFVVDTGHCKIMVDTCVGNDRSRPGRPMWEDMQTPFLERLTMAGYSREDIDIVVCTHMHVDHVGWNTMKESDDWVPTFPNARYLIARSEFEHWERELASMQAASDFNQLQAVVYADSIQPVLDAGLVELVATDHQISAEVKLLPTPGHTPGHVSIEIVSNGEHALITGDFAHHPCQLAYPDWGTAADSDQDMSAQTRWRIFGEICDKPVLVLGTHWPSPTAGQVQRSDPGFRLCC